MESVRENLRILSSDPRLKALDRQEILKHLKKTLYETAVGLKKNRLKDVKTQYQDPRGHAKLGNGELANFKPYHRHIEN